MNQSLDDMFDDITVEYRKLKKQIMNKETKEEIRIVNLHHYAEELIRKANRMERVLRKIISPKERKGPRSYGSPDLLKNL
jgi:hypothetical protein